MGKGGLEVVPGLLRRAIEEEAWKERKDWRGTGNVYPALPSLRALIEARPPDGLGTTPDLIRRIIFDDQNTLMLFEEALVRKHGTNRHTKVENDNINLYKPEQGTSRAYVLRRLKRKRADLFDKVVAGDLSANAAAIEAGFKKKPTSLDVLIATWRKASAEERATFLREIGH